MNRSVLIVSPHYPPINAADMHRVRMSLPHFSEFGWDPVVLTVRPKDVEGVMEPFLLETLPAGLAVSRVAALPVRWTHILGVGNLGLRAMPFLYQSGRRLLHAKRIDLVYFSTTMFATMALGRLWKQEFGVPFVLDMQDPWVNEYVEQSPQVQPPKYWLMKHLHRVLERWTMEQVGGLIAVSSDYIEALQRRYPKLMPLPARTLPFGAAERDFEVARAHANGNRFFQPHNGELHGVYVGRGGNDMAPALRVVLGALRQGLEQNPQLFSKVRLHFIGTDYASDHRSTQTVEPIAREMGLGSYVREHPQRIPYFEALQLLLDADFLMVIGSDDAQYSASKIYPYLLARKPLVCALPEASRMWNVLRQACTSIVSFSPDRTYTAELAALWGDQLSRLPETPRIESSAFAAFRARELTREQCKLFDQVVETKTCPVSLQGCA
jgi:hypothetical protein